MRFSKIKNITDSGVIATLTFTALEVDEETYASVSVEKLDDDDFLCYTGKDGKTETNLPCTVSEASGVTVKACLPGDANGDGEVTNKDAARILQYVAHWDVEIDLDAADANGYTKVTFEYTLVKEIVFGEPESEKKTDDTAE